MSLYTKSGVEVLLILNKVLRLSRLRGLRIG